MNKSELTCSIPMAQLLAAVPEDADIGSVTVFVGVKGSGVFMASHMGSNPEEVAAMISALGEAKRSIVEGIIRDHGMQMLVSIMFFLASNHADAQTLGEDPAELLKRYFVPGGGNG